MKKKMVTDMRAHPKVPIQIQLPYYSVKPGTLVITVFGVTYKDNGKGGMKKHRCRNTCGAVDYNYGIVTLRIGDGEAKYVYDPSIK